MTVVAAEVRLVSTDGNYENDYTSLDTGSSILTMTVDLIADIFDTDYDYDYDADNSYTSDYNPVSSIFKSDYTSDYNPISSIFKSDYTSDYNPISSIFKSDYTSDYNPISSIFKSDYTSDYNDYTSDYNDYTSDYNDYTSDYNDYTSDYNDYTSDYNDYTTAKNDYTSLHESFGGSYIPDDNEDYTPDFDRSETWWYDDLDYDDPDYSRAVPEGSAKHTCQEIEPQVILPDSFTVTMDVTWRKRPQNVDYISRVTVEYDKGDINFQIQYKAETMDTGTGFDLNLTVVENKAVGSR